MNPLNVITSDSRPHLRSVGSQVKSSNSKMISNPKGENTVETPLIGISPAIEKIRKTIARVSKTKLTVVISGESGVGKEVVANNLYHQSDRCGKPLVKVNCAALPDGLMESELFGHELGAFTGAYRRKRGKFELSDGGALLLDEIGDMPLPLQAKLLHVLQCGVYSPLGSENSIDTDVWVICLTNHDLISDMKEKQFREDLYYRISTINIHIPPLRERKEDIQPLINHFIQEYAPQDTADEILTHDQLDQLVRYHWPGNIRELQSVIKRILILDDANEVISSLKDSEKANDTSICFANDATNNSKLFVDGLLRSSYGLNEYDGLSLKEVRNRALQEIEKVFISRVLDQTQWNRIKTSKILKISYKSLLNKIKELNLIDPKSEIK